MLVLLVVDEPEKKKRTVCVFEEKAGFELWDFCCLVSVAWSVGIWRALICKKSSDYFRHALGNLMPAFCSNVLKLFVLKTADMFWGKRVAITILVLHVSHMRRQVAVC
jgi:hypothetical protein